MWYFAWLLGLPLAAMFAVVNAMWLELQEDRRTIDDPGPDGPGSRDRAGNVRL
ncbi:cytochrome bd-I oxidase subunit CydX [Hoeflea ulvae]|uniref:Cytochrome bd-I oxidase subunit CydX n=1 Tax=Hoeflea ulvae TaxID=2983764 RepID=A0ABT3YCJ4_9HYPH|nr:cytochrome bd-I oxidase subunit CydX [Hoeflea ulvae]MCY0093480.1 cytochrome bd-I oxidase subunit CydX [Hoeflea ulvae]